MKKIYAFGNPLVKEDSLPIKLLPQMKKKFPKIRFKLVDPNENFPAKKEKNLIIIDTVKGIKEPMILDLDDFNREKPTPISPHDYDLLFHLLLLKKQNKIKSVKIIGCPFKTTKTTKTTLNTIVVKVVKIISSLLGENERRRTYRDQRHGLISQSH